MSTRLHAERAYDPIDLSALSFWEERTEAERGAAFAELRAARPVSWQRPPESVLQEPSPDDPGYWAVVDHAGIVEVSRRSDVFVSGQGVMFQEIPVEMLEATQSMLAMDAPRHTKIRHLISSAFTPRQIARVEAQIADQARRIVDDLLECRGEFDFVRQVSSRLPMMTISEMIGLPPEQWEEVTYHANAMISLNDPEIAQGREPLEVAATSIFALHAIAGELAPQRREHPQDDLLTALVQARIDGEGLTDAEIAAFFVLLCVAGNDTTKQTTSHAMLALSDHPDQRAWLAEDFEGRIATAVEEFVRWATPVLTFRRTAVAEYRLGGVDILPGDKVAMFYLSGNRDEKVFERPDQFDITRNPNPHNAFGGGGVHFCLGTQLARTQLRCIFRELLGRAPQLVAHDPVMLPNSFIHSIARMPARLA